MKFSGATVFGGTRFIGRATVEVSGASIATVIPGGTGQGMLMPGITDSHVHLLSVGLARLALDLADIKDKTSFTAALKQYAETSGSSQWIVGRGWDQNRLGFIPDRQVLDAIVPRQPVALTRVCGHVLAANSEALRRAGVTEATAEVPGGVIRRDEGGRPTGILEEKAMDLVRRHIPRPDAGQLYDALTEAVGYAHSCGVTGVQTDDMLLAGSYSRLWDLYRRVTASHPLRAQLHYHIRSAEDLQEYVNLRRELEPSDYVCPGPAKLFLDGSLGARTAALLQPYSDAPDTRGVLTCSGQQLEEIIRLAEQSGVQLALHAIGDAAIALALDTLAAVRGGYKRGISHRLIHCQVTAPGQVAKMVELGLVAEIQPVFLQTDKDWAPARLGPQRLQLSYCWRHMWQHGLHLAGGSDAPVEDLNPWHGIHTAVTRRDNSGNPAQGWQKEQALTLEQALSLFTSNSASLAPWPAGRLAPGAAADLVLYNNFYRERLWQNRPDLVVINGNTVWQG